MMDVTYVPVDAALRGALIGMGVLCLSLAALAGWALWRLRQRLQRLDRALDAHCMINVTDARGRIVEVNDRFLRDSGFARAEVLGRSVVDLGLVEADPRQAERIEAQLVQGKVWTGETEWCARDGRRHWTRSTIVPRLARDGALIDSISLRTDITEVRLTSAETQLRATLDLLQDEVWMFAPDDLRFLYLNRQALDRFGWDPASYAGRSVTDAGGLIDLAELRRRTRRLLQGVEKAVTYAVQDGPRTVEITLQLVRPAGNPARFVAVLRDITDRLAATRAKSDFIAMVSHELRTPLTSIKGGLGVLEMTVAEALPEKARGILGIAQRNADRLIQLVNDILDIAKIDAGKMELRMERTDLSHLIREAIDANAAYGAQFGVRYSGVGLERPVPVEASPERLFQVLTNLMSNAAKFSRRGDVVEVGLREMGGKVRVFVKDRGTGIPLEAQPRILERFTQAEAPDRRRVGGTGLGLSIVKAIVEHHGAEIRFDSVPGQGSEFWFDLTRPAPRNAA